VPFFVLLAKNVAEFRVKRP